MEIRELIKKINSKGRLYRTSTIKRDAINVDSRTVEIAFSSEEPYERYFGIEILSHENAAVDMSWIGSGSAPYLDGHDPGRQIGVIEKAWLDSDKRGRAIVRFSKNQEADAVFKDIVDGIKKNVSVGYEVKSMVLEKDDEESGKTYRVDGWIPLEASQVSIPADRTVGVGREHLSVADQKVEHEKNNNQKEAETMPEEKKVDTAKVERETREKELARIKEITALGNHEAGDFRDLAHKAISEGTSVDDFRKIMLENIKKIEADNGDLVDHDPELGLSRKEVKQYSFLKLVRAMVSGKRSDAPFELECAEEFEKLSGRRAKGNFIPPDMFKAGAFFGEEHANILARSHMVRDLTTLVGSQGGYTVAENLMTSSFIDLLTNLSMVFVAGATTLNDLVGDIDIPKQTGGTTAYWVGEGDNVTESQPALGQIRMSPNTIGVLTDITRRLLMQSSISVESFLRMDMMRSAALEIDSAALNGIGAAGTPRGILNTTGIGSVTLNAANTPDWGDIVDLETEVLTDNALMGSLSYMTNATISGNMKQTDKGTDTGRFLLDKGETNGYPLRITGQVPAGYIIFGNWADLVVAFWSGLDVNVDTSTMSASGGTRIVALQDCDVAIRHAESFAKGYA